MDNDNPYQSSGSDQYDSQPQPEVDPSELLDVAESLDNAVGNCEPISQLTLIDEGFAGYRLIANRAALLRFAAAMLRLASRCPNDAEETLLQEAVTHKQLVNNPSDGAITEVRHSTTLPQPYNVVQQRKLRLWLKDRSFLIGCAVIGFVVIGLLLSGIMLWYLILTGKID